MPALIPSGRDAVAAMTPSAYVTAESLREGDPAEHEAVHLSSSDGKPTRSALVTRSRSAGAGVAITG